MYNNFADAVKTKRKEEKYSLLKLGEITGITPSYINRIENGERKSPNVDICIKLVKELNINVLEIKEIDSIKSFLNILIPLYKEKNSELITNIDDILTESEELKKILAFILEREFNEFTCLGEISEFFRLINDYKYVHYKKNEIMK